MRSARGQGTVEYLAVVLLVMVMAGGATAAVAQAAGADIATSVPHEIRRALCIVTGGDCDRDRAPCTTASSSDGSAWSATILVIRVGRDKVLLREHRSDGSVLVTETTAGSLGLETIEGAGVQVDRGRRSFGLGGAVTASIVASLGHGSTWVLPGERDANALTAALAADEPVRPPDRELRQLGVTGSATAARDAGEGEAATASATASVHGAAGRQIDHVTGERTYFIEVGAEAMLELSAGLGDLAASANGSGGLSGRLALAVDRTGRWVDLAVVGSGEVTGRVSLPPGASPAEALDVPTSGGRRLSVEAHLDLTDAGNLAAARALVDAARSIPPRPRAVVDAAAGFARRANEHAVVDVRTYAVDRAADGFAVHAGEVLGLGLGHESTTEKTRLIAAATRGLDGQWRRREDCLRR